MLFSYAAEEIMFPIVYIRGNKKQISRRYAPNLPCMKKYSDHFLGVLIL
jgi:hypothetical protein